MALTWKRIGTGSSSVVAKSDPRDKLLCNRDEKKKTINTTKLVEESTEVSILKMISKENHTTF